MGPNKGGVGHETNDDREYAALRERELLVVGQVGQDAQLLEVIHLECCKRSHMLAQTVLVQDLGEGG